MNAGVIAALLTDCIAAMLCAVGRRSRAGITKAENTKNTPAIRPLPRAVPNVAHSITRFIAGRPARRALAVCPGFSCLCSCQQ